MTRRLLIACGLVLAVLTAAGTALLIAQLHARIIADAGQELQDLGQSLAEQTDRSFQAVELIQNGLIAEIKAAGIDDRASFDREMRKPAVLQTLRDKVVGLPQVEAMSVFSADGHLLNFSRFWPTPNLYMGDRNYFSKLVDSSSGALIITEPVLNRGTGTWTVFAARRLNTSRGELLGFLMNAMDLGYFEAFYGAVSQSGTKAITLLNYDGSLIARFPHADMQLVTTSPNMPATFKLAFEKTLVAPIQSVSPVDHVNRLIAAHASTRYPLVQSISKPMDLVLAPWRQASLYLILFAAVMMSLIVLAVVLSLKQLDARCREAHLARHDPLTRLPNRVLLLERLAGFVQHRWDDTFALLMIDIDYFKTVNDTLGHPTGDKLLCALSELLLASARPSDLVVRLGGDEFAIIQYPSGGSDDAVALAARILADLKKPLVVGDRSMVVGVTIGVVVPDSVGAGPDELFRRADLALYEAKAAGRARYTCYDRALDEEICRRQLLTVDLAHAVAKGQLRLHYQPVVDLTSGATIGCEALVRWDHPRHGLLPPADFISLAETTGLIVAIGRWVLQVACAEASRWAAPTKIAVNLSPIQLADGDILDDVRRCLVETKLAPERLELEITEAVLMSEGGRALPILHALREMGVQIVLDDFGTGYSSLRYLVQFPFDRIKLDRSFVQEMDDKSSSRAVVTSTVGLARGLGIELTAEGIETQRQLEMLWELGVREGQGYYFGRPAPIEAMVSRPALASSPATADPPKPARPRGGSHGWTSARRRTQQCAKTAV